MKNVMPRPYFSFSQMNSYNFNKKQFLETYYYGKFQSSSYLELGKKVGEALQFRDTIECKEIELVREQIPVSPIYEYEIKTKLGKIDLLGYLDGYNPKRTIIIEHKTGRRASEASWRKQMLFYSLMLYLSENKMPKKIKLYWMPTIFNEEEQLVLTGEVREYVFKIELEEILLFSVEIKKIYEEIKELCEYEYLQFGVMPKN